jgi:glycosyltransferase involved in cell wall biosynthesis
MSFSGTIVTLRAPRGAMDKTWLSVIIPCRNGDRWLTDTLQSVVDQQDHGIEVIFVDGSTDDASVEIAECFSDKLDLRIFRRHDLLSWMAKTNFGVEQASAEQICMLHTDDLWLPNRSAQLQNWLSSQPDAVMHLHPCYIVDEAGRRLGLWRCPLPADGSPVPAQLFYERLLVQNFIGIPTPAIRRDAYLMAGGLDKALWYTADWDLYLKVASIGNICYHSTTLACFRVHRNSLTVLGSRDIQDFREQHAAIVDRHISKLAPDSRTATLRLSEASIEVNVALAAAVAGKFGAISKALGSVLFLGPAGIARYLSYSRIVDRALPRLRAAVAGRF